MRLAILVVFGLVCLCASAQADPLILSEQYRITGNVETDLDGSDPDDPVVDGYDHVGTSNLFDHVDGLSGAGNYATSSAGRTGNTFQATAEASTPSAGYAFGFASARSTILFQPDSDLLFLGLSGEVAPYVNVSVRLTDVASNTNLVSFDLAPDGNPEDFVPYELSGNISVDPSRAYRLSLFVNSSGYEPISMTRATAFVTLAAGDAGGPQFPVETVPVPPAAWGGLALLGTCGAGHFLRRRLA